MHKRLFLFLFLSMGILFGWMYLRVWLFPPAAKPPDKSEEEIAREDEAKKNQEAIRKLHETLLAAAHAGVKGGEPYDVWLRLIAPALKAAMENETRSQREAKADVPPIILGDPERSNLTVVIDRRNATIRSVTLNRFNMLDRRYARPELDENGKPKRRVLFSDDQDGSFAKLPYADRRAKQSYDLFPKPGSDPIVWDEQVLTIENGVAFTGKLGPNVRVIKQLTLLDDQYHVGLELRFERIKPGEDAKIAYELSGPRGLIPEGTHWADRPFRNVVFGVQITNDRRENRDFQRWLLDPIPIREGKAPLPSLNSGAEPNVLQYAGVMMPHFAALVVLDGNAAELRYIDQVAAEFLGDETVDPGWEKYAGDVSVRVASTNLAVGDEPLTHKYLLYAGPSKVMLLNYESNVQPGLVDRYMELRLYRLTDSPSDWWLPKFFWNIGWTRLIIWFTNLMHMLLEWLHSLVGQYGVAIILMTIMVRALMFPVSRKQAQISQRMQDKMGALAPERTKIREKFKDNPTERQKAEMELFRKHGVNPLGGCTGCLILLLQMPIFMGLYYALQESVHLRQAGFLWSPNLAAPDMLFFWADWPVFNWLARGWLRLGDWFNLLPIISVLLMLVQQKMMTPQTMTEEQAAQMRMMNFMMIFMGYMFYWLYSGLCLYFIVSSVWGVLERKLVPKLSTAKPDAPPPSESGAKPKPPPKNGTPASGFRKRLSDWWTRLLNEAQKKNK